MDAMPNKSMERRQKQLFSCEVVFFTLSLRVAVSAPIIFAVRHFRSCNVMYRKMTFPKNLKLSGFGFALILLLSFVAFGQQSRFSSKYKNPQAEGLYFVESPNGTDERALVISSNNKPIPPKANEPDATTIPEFYLFYTKRIAFEKVEVIGKRVYFKTRSGKTFNQSLKKPN